MSYTGYFTFFLLLGVFSTLFSITARAQNFPEPSQLKKNKVRILSAGSMGGTTYYMIDENGYTVKTAYEDETFQKPESAYKIYYGASNKPDSIVSTMNSGWAEYFQYSPSGTIQISKYSDHSDTIWLDKTGNKIKGKGSDGSTLKYEYNAKKQLIKETFVSAKENYVITYSYNTIGQLVKSVRSADFESTSETFTYNKNGLMATRTSDYGGGSKFVMRFGYQTF